jgi:hypothetical protein
VACGGFQSVNLIEPGDKMSVCINGFFGAPAGHRGALVGWVGPST